MKQIDCSPLEKKSSSQVGLENALTRLSQSLSRNATPAQTVLINALDKVLDHKFHALLNVPVEGCDKPVPIILVGPPGVWVIHTSSEKGIFRANEANWEELDERSRRYNLTRPNLVEQTLEMASVVSEKLKSYSEKTPVVEPVLFFSDPGTHVDSSRPAVRIVQADAAERFAAGVAHIPPMMTQERVQAAVAALAGSAVSVKEPDDIRDVFSFRDLPPEKPVQKPRTVIVDKAEPELLNRVPFNRRQLIVLGSMIVVNLIIITILVVMILLNT